MRVYWGLFVVCKGSIRNILITTFWRVYRRKNLLADQNVIPIYQQDTVLVSLSGKSLYPYLFWHSIPVADHSRQSGPPS